MGIGIEVNRFENKIIESLGIAWVHIKVCELGNQKIKFRSPRIPAKKYYKKLGVQEHVSIDLNGKNGALQIDLDFPVPGNLLNRFNMVTNYGTLEHVNNQYQAFKNMHDVCKKEGIMIHSFPPTGHWEGHGRYFYSEKFAEQLAHFCSYEIIGQITRVTRGGEKGHDLILAAFKKITTDFIDQQTFLKLEYEDTKDLTTTGNYTQKKRNILNRLFNKNP